MICPKIKIALPKGRFLRESLSIICTYLNRRGISSDEIRNFASRKLVFEYEDVVFLLLKASDICDFTCKGHVDLGIVPDEWMLEYELDKNISFNKLKKLDWIHTRLSLISTANHKKISKSDKVASTFPNIAKQYLRSVGMKIDVYKISGSLEATIPQLFSLGVDCIETGETLKQNSLEEREIIYRDMALTAISYKNKKNINPKKLLTLI